MRKRFIYLLLCIVLVVALVPAGAVSAADTSSYKGASSWAVPELDKAVQYGFITDKIKDNMAGNITREEFAEVAVKLYELYTGTKAVAGTMKFSDTTNVEIFKAANLGMVSGIGGGKYGPGMLVTREQMAAIMYRTLKVLNPSADFSADTVKFVDDSKITSYFKESVYYCSKNGVMKGGTDSSGNSVFNPKGNSTREQAVIVCVRGYELYKKVENSGSTQGAETAVSFSSDTLKQIMEKQNSYRRTIRTVSTYVGYSDKYETIKEFAYVRSPLSTYTILDFPGQGSYNGEIIIGEKLWSKISKDDKWTGYDSYESEFPLAFRYDVSTQAYPIEYQKLAFTKVGTEKVNDVNCIKYTVSGTYTSTFAPSSYYPEDKYPIKLTASGSIWVADDTALKQVMIRQRITIDTDITYDNKPLITKDVIEDDVTGINSTVIKPPVN